MASSLSEFRGGGGCGGDSECVFTLGSVNCAQRLAIDSFRRFYCRVLLATIKCQCSSRVQVDDDELASRSETMPSRGIHSILDVKNKCSNDAMSVAMVSIGSLCLGPRTEKRSND